MICCYVHIKNNTIWRPNVWCEISDQKNKPHRNWRLSSDKTNIKYWILLHVLVVLIQEGGSNTEEKYENLPVWKQRYLVKMSEPRGLKCPLCHWQGTSLRQQIVATTQEATLHQDTADNKFHPPTAVVHNLFETTATRLPTMPWPWSHRGEGQRKVVLSLVTQNHRYALYYTIRYDTIDDLHWKTDRQAASFI